MPQYTTDENPVALLIGGLAGVLPPKGAKFSRAARERWIEAVRVNLELLYADQDDDD